MHSKPPGVWFCAAFDLLTGLFVLLLWIWLGMGSIAFGWVDYFICFIAGLAALTGACLLLSPRWARRVALFSQINIVVACVLLAVVLGLYCIWDPTSLVRGSTGALGVIAIVVVVVMPAVFLAAVAGAQALYLSRANVKAAFEK